MRSKVYQSSCVPPKPNYDVILICYGFFDSGDNHSIAPVEALGKKILRRFIRHFPLP